MISAILFLILRMRRFIVSTLQFCRSAISSSDKPSARIFKIAFSSRVKPHSRISFSRSAVGNCSFDFFPGIRTSSSVLILFTSQRRKNQLNKVFRFLAQAVDPAEFLDGCSHVNPSFFVGLQVFLLIRRRRPRPRLFWPYNAQVFFLAIRG